MDLSFITDRIAVGGGIWTADKMSEVARFGITHIIDMQIEFDDTPLAQRHGIKVLWNAIDDPVRAAKAAAILSLVGAADVPIIHFSVDWWNTLHQPASIIRLGGPTIDKSFLWPLFVMMTAYTMLFAWLWLLRMQTEIFERRAPALMMAKGA